MSVANQQASTQMRGVVTWPAITTGAIALILITAALSWFAYDTITPKAGGVTVAATGATSSIANPALVEFRQGEQGASAPFSGFLPAPGLVQFRQGEQGASVSVGEFTPTSGLVEFRHGEQSN